ncbi:MAG: hypothetical protein A3J52_01610 [Omnitrophica bacterium RIFCSPHIGHO2_02_FULL_49_9]|nr:MAG: hypothetical protein A3J52_01610 [Omnitrophica bacterium RIFCSPHIGHO2_02_FULL_49_9]
MDSRLIDLARNAGKILLSYRGKELNIQNKGGGSFNPVTDADLKANELLQTELSKYYSNDLILSEENTNIPADYSARVWMIDPLDGTSEFIHGGPLFGVHIALCDNGTLQLGLVYTPVTDELYYAEKDSGAYLQTPVGTQRLHVSDVEDLSHARMITRINRGYSRPEDTLVNQFQNPKIELACIGIKLGLIAQGKAEFNIHANPKSHKWDTAAPQLILEEAGGKITDLSGQPLDYTQAYTHWKNGFLASNGVLHEKVLEKIRENSFRL